MRLDMIANDHFILTDDASFVNLTLEQTQRIWSNLHLDYPDLFVYLGEHVLESQRARRTLQVMVDRAGSVATAMEAIETGVVKLSKVLKVKKADVARRPIHETVKPIRAEGPFREGGVPVLPSLPIEEIPTAPVFRWEPRPAKKFALQMETAVLELEPVGAE